MKVTASAKITATQILTMKSRAATVSRALTKLKGFDLTGPFTGVLSVGSKLADVRFEANETIRCTMPVPIAKSAGSPLRVNGGLPGNVRFALRGDVGQLVADTQVDGQAHLPDTFRDIQAGFRRALGAKAIRNQTHKDVKLDGEQLREVVEQLNWAASAVVQQDDGWELRPRVQGEATAVRLIQINRSAEVCIQRTVLATLPSKETVQAASVIDQALRLNSQLRHVRLADHNGTLVCQARLRSGLLQPEWLSMTARAVAVAWRHVELLLRILAEHEDIAKTYVNMLCSTVEQTAPCGVSE